MIDILKWLWCFVAHSRHCYLAVHRGERYAGLVRCARCGCVHVVGTTEEPTNG